MSDMTREEAWKIIGNQPEWAIKNMIMALEMMSIMNTAEENKRLEAAKIAVKTSNPRFD